MPPVTMDNMGNLDPTTYMSPMDLYESIWWGECKSSHENSY
jgi:hypothetical protein